MSEAETKGRWVRDDEVHPLTNMWGRRWRFRHMDGTITAGTAYGGERPQFHPAGLEWFFEEVQG